MPEKLIKQSIHFKQSEWNSLKAKKDAEQKKIGYKISVNKFLRKIVLGGNDGVRKSN